MSASNTAADGVEKQVPQDYDPSSARPLFWVGVLLAIGVVLVFFVQVFVFRRLVTPWYLPIGGTVAAGLVVLAVIRRKRLIAIGTALLCVSLAGMEWFFVLGTALPAYTGPIAAGSPLPEFHAKLADGTEIDAEYFKQGRPTALVFYQGRWCPFCMTQLKEFEEHHDVLDGANANLVVVSVEGLDLAAETQRDFPHLKVVSDEQKELSSAVDLINRGFAPGGLDTDAPTVLIVDGQGIVKKVFRPARIITRPSAAELAKMVEESEAR